MDFAVSDGRAVEKALRAATLESNEAVAGTMIFTQVLVTSTVISAVAGLLA